MAGKNPGEPSLDAVMEKAGLSERMKKKLLAARDDLTQASSPKPAEAPPRPKGSGASHEVVRPPQGL